MCGVLREQMRSICARRTDLCPAGAPIGGQHNLFFNGVQHGISPEAGIEHDWQLVSGGNVALCYLTFSK